MFKNMKLSTKQISGFVCISFIIAFVGLIGMNGLKTTGKAFDKCMDVEMPIVDASMEGMIAVISGRDLMGEFLLSEDTAALEEAEKEFNKSIADFDQHAGYIAKNASTELKKLADTADKYHSVFQENAVELMKHHRLHISAEQKADLLMKGFDQDADELKQLLSNYEEKLTRNKKIDEKVDAAMEAKTFMVEQKAITEEYMGLESLTETENLRNDFKEKEAQFDSLEKLLPNEIIKKHEKFSALSIKLFDQQDESLRMQVETRKHMALVDEFSEKADQTMDRVEEASAKNMENAMANADAAQSKANFLIIVITITGFILGIVLGVFISRSITNPLNLIIEGLNEGANQVASASGQVSSSSQSLAEGSSEQAAALEETSSSLEEMSSMTKQNADNAAQADNLMKESNQVVVKANSSMTQLTQSMGEITKASEETSKIIKTIDEIAFQTNLLALNAAVEAARAGEAGAGFAVVADEVRNLAMRAAEAAKNTANLIEGTVIKVKNGSDLVDTTNQAFEEVASSAVKVGELVGEIAEASNEQSRGIDQVNKAVNEMDQVTQQNAANAEESASASEEMNAQAEQMKNFVGELVAIVGSNDKGNGRLTKKTKAARFHHTEPHPVRASKQLVARESKKSYPAEVLPLEEDNFEDF